ncbi:hypothetical protein I5976_01055 [Clostridioides difficile]|uniref:hypothetical protein n=1 Tax=Clostridioides difficile TaxID=1496 RepID=UPI000943E118|nr:hypothetical protein [Clostridioides difficile]EGT4053402.1 hypothetical protein [Clostridioides difficile]MBH7041030.1 hypothetical protein [Clostridioides difficile]MBY2164203.1 hypothetical protein [Clostridioides difficile]MBY2659932.1 hypothetical protein [Clostridioides difficile]MBZ0662751.1 hypothetical protein [Clostridioides difficile]
MNKTIVCDYCNKRIDKDDNEYITFGKKNYAEANICINCALNLIDKDKLKESIINNQYRCLEK